MDKVFSAFFRTCIQSLNSAWITGQQIEIQNWCLPGKIRMRGKISMRALIISSIHPRWQHRVPNEDKKIKIFETCHGWMPIIKNKMQLQLVSYQTDHLLAFRSPKHVWIFKWIKLLNYISTRVLATENFQDSDKSGKMKALKSPKTL